MDWQPIETAPRAPADSPETIDVLCYYVNGVIAVMYWSNGWWPVFPDEDKPWADPLLWAPIEEPATELVRREIDRMKPLPAPPAALDDFLASPLAAEPNKAGVVGFISDLRESLKPRS